MIDPKQQGQPDWGGGSEYDDAPDPVAKRLGKAAPQPKTSLNTQQLDKAIRGFEQAKAYALQPGISDEERQKALRIARQIGGQLQGLGYEYGEPGGWPYVKPTKAAPYYPTLVAQHISSGLPAFSAPPQSGPPGQSPGAGMLRSPAKHLEPANGAASEAQPSGSVMLRALAKHLEPATPQEPERQPVGAGMLRALAKHLQPMTPQESGSQPAGVGMLRALEDYLQRADAEDARRAHQEQYGNPPVRQAPTVNDQSLTSPQYHTATAYRATSGAELPLRQLPLAVNQSPQSPRTTESVSVTTGYQRAPIRLPALSQVDIAPAKPVSPGIAAYQNIGLGQYLERAPAAVLDIATRPFQYLSTLTSGIQRGIGDFASDVLQGKNVLTAGSKEYSLYNILDAAAERFYTGKVRPGFEQPVAKLYELAVEKYGGDPDSAIHSLIRDSLSGVTDPVSYMSLEGIAEGISPGLRAGKAGSYVKPDYAGGDPWSAYKEIAAKRLHPPSRNEGLLKLIRRYSKPRGLLEQIQRISETGQSESQPHAGSGVDPGTLPAPSEGAAPATRHRGTTSMGVERKNQTDWRILREVWDTTGISDILSPENRALITQGRVPIVDANWIRYFPGDASLVGQRISMHHILGSPLKVPLPKSRHLGAHKPGGTRWNRGGPGRTGD